MPNHKYADLSPSPDSEELFWDLTELLADVSQGWDGYVTGDFQVGEPIRVALTPGEMLTLGPDDFDESLDQVWQRLQAGETVILKTYHRSTLRLVKGHADA